MYFDSLYQGLMTPLLISSKKGFTDVINMLVDAGADLHAEDKVGFMPRCQQNKYAVKYQYKK